MRSLSVRFLLPLLILVLVPTAFAHNITITGTHNFSSLDGGSSDHDGLDNGVFTVNDGNLTINGTVNCNDGLIGGPCAMTFNVSGNMTLNAGSALYSEDRLGLGSPASITLNVGGNLILNGNAGSTPGAMVSAAALLTSVANGGNVTANVTGSTTVGSGATIDAGSYSGNAGKITINGGGLVSVDGNLYAGPSRNPSGLMGGYLFGGGGLQKGGEISVKSTTFAEPAVLIGGNAAIITQGEITGTGPVTIEGCGVEVRGLVASTSRQNTSSRVSIRSGKNLLVDSRDLGVSGSTPLNRKGSIRADGMLTGSAQNRGVDLFAGGNITILGPAAGSSSVYPLSSCANALTALADGGNIRIISLGGTVTASGRVADASSAFTGGEGGNIQVSSKGSASLDTAHLRAIGQYSLPVPGRSGGDIAVRSHSGNVVWTNGNGDVRPIGSTSGLPASQQGTITLTACGTVNTMGSTFPANGVPTGVFPVIVTGACSPAAPSLPVGVPVLLTCNTPPVANDTSATTNEDTTVTINLSGSDVDGNPLTFSIVSGPSNGTLGPIVPTGPTTATVNYSPNLNFNGSDSFVYQANDGNGGTDNATATITVNPVNDPPSFLAGATVIRLEDSGAQTVPGWASLISPGPADEAGQTVTFTVTNDNNALFSVQPAVASNGTLTFTPAANANGTANLTITAQDNGGTANGGDDTSNPQTSAINITAVNDEPSFTAGPNQTVNEDAGPQTAAGWATGISAGPNEGSQTVNFVVSNNNNALFAAQPAVASNGTLTYTPAANANGVATVSVYAQDNGGTANGGDDTSPTQTFTITVNAVNDEPSFTGGGNVSVNEDSGAYSAAWATAISAGPADESGQTVNFSASNDNNGLFSAQPAISASGVLSFTVAANASGSATVTVTLSDNGGTANGGDDTSNPQNFTITVNAVNDEPSFTPGGDVTVNEDSGAYSAAWASAISAGAGEGSQTVTFVVSNDNNALFASQPAVSASGVLSFTPAADASGSATVTVYLTDDGGTANGGDDTSPSVTFTITVNSVNDAPSFVSGGNVSVNEDSGAYSAAWATSISAGPANESGQTLTFNITGNTNAALFASGPSISSAGVLSFTLTANAFGSSSITVTLSDNGGTANGGVDTSAPQSFTITVNAVNDAPSFTPGGNVSVNEDSGAYSAAWATGISAGPNESGQTVAFNTSNNNNALFSVQPSISPAGVLTFTPAPNAFGSATVSVYLQDNGGTANGGVDTSATVNFTITVNSINDPPTAANDSWETEGNTELRVDLTAGATPNVADTTPSGTGVLHNDSDPVEGSPIAIVGVVGCADVTAPFDCAVTGGTVSLNANGSFSFQPAPGIGAGSFQYTLSDGTDTANGTVTITIHDRIWYVNGSAPAGGNGTSSLPFNSFASLNGMADVDIPGDYIFVHSSNVGGSIALEASQKLWGQGVGLVIPRNLNGNGFPTVIVAAGARPNVSSTADTVTVTGVTGVEIAGLNLASSAGNGIDVTSPVGAPASATIYSNEILSAAQEGIDINAGSSVGTTVSIDGTSVTSTGNGVDLLATDGNVVFSYSNGTINSVSGSGLVANGSAADTFIVNGLSNVTINGNTAGSGVSITAARFDANAGTAAFDTLSAGALNVGVSGNPVGGAAVVLNNASGDLAFTSINAYGSTTGVTIAGSGLFTGSAGMRVTNGGGAVSAAAGTGLSVTNTTIGAANLSFTSISATGGASGIVVNNTGTVGGLKVLGTGTAGSGGTISGSTAHSIALTNTTAPAFAWLNVANSGGNGIDAVSVNGLTLTSCQVTSAGNGDNEHGMRLSNVSGAVVINGTAFSHSAEDLILVDNTNTNMSLTVGSSSSFSHAAALGPFAGNGINMIARGSTAYTVNVTNSTFTNVALTAFHLGGDGTTTGLQTVDITGNQFTVTIPGRSTNVNVQIRNTSTADIEVLNNTMTGVGGGAVNIGADEDSTVGAKVNGNIITNSVAAGILAAHDDDSVLRIEVDDNQLTNIGGDGIEIVNFGGVGISELDAVITNNNVDGHNTNPSTAFIAGIAVFGFEDNACVVLRGNSVTGTTPSYFDYSLEEFGGVMTLEEIPDTPATIASDTYILSINSGSSGTVDLVGPIDLTNGASCDRP